ncbi:uncharacterized protein LOC116770755 isoform X3 [Danaus plexippus]|uniref:uncharacterized protein LOC116770755 isoform X3 n=1 Tax=Danaus plexippus TaxID=13037 RepID=UPI0013C45CAE|nr:uncharacterized protein LOC116770755 isoform X3 [Danaus plexippus]
MEAQDILDTSKLTFEGDFEQQVEEILLHVRLTKEEVLRLQTLFDDVYNALNKVWDGIKVHAFGSIVTGLGIKLRLDTAMCVQDPFEQSRNCAVRVHPKLFQHVMNKFRNAVSDFDNNHEKAVLKKLLFRTIDNPPPVSRDGHRVRLKGVQKRFNNNKNKFQLNQRNKQNVQHLKSQLQKKQQTQT